MRDSFIDFHCHLDLYPDFKRAVQECERAGIYTLAVTTTPRAWPRNKMLTEGLNYVRPALGLHPQLVGTNTKDELLLWEKYLPQASYIGEVGLDAGPDFIHTFEEQKKVLARILVLCAEEGNKVISIHAVRSVDAVLDMIEATLGSSGCRVVFHWFTGSKKQAVRAVNLGCYFSVNLPMVLNVRSASVVKSLPTERLLTESDGPFINFGSRPARSADIHSTVQSLASLLECTPKDLGVILTRNLKALLTFT